MTKKQVNVRNAGDAARGNYTDTLKKIVSEKICPFCEKNLHLHHKKPILFKNKYWIVTTNAWPYAGTKHHFLLITRAHLEKAEDGSPDMWKEMQSAYKKLCKLYKIQGATLVMRSGSTEYTGATVRHLHAQIIVGQKRKETYVPITAVAGYKKP